MYKEVADPGKRYNRVNNPADPMTSSSQAFPDLAYKEWLIFSELHPELGAVLSWHFNTPFLSSVSYAPHYVLPLIMFLVKVPSKTGNKWSTANNRPFNLFQSPSSLHLQGFVSVDVHSPDPADCKPLGWGPVLLLHQSPQSHTRPWRAQADWMPHTRCRLQPVSAGWTVRELPVSLQPRKEKIKQTPHAAILKWPARL